MHRTTLAKICIAAALVLSLAVPAAAQQPSQPALGGNDQTMLLGLGLTFVNAADDTGAGLNVNALFNALETNESGRLGIVGDFGINDVRNGAFVTLMGGPRFTFNMDGQVVPYAQFLVGFTHWFDDTDFAPAIGGGIDVAWRPRINFRGELQFFLNDPEAVRFFLGVSLPVNKR
ncbi:MAG: hypothetical protein IT183_04360 [Acidobacteria bacterium]|nr:hypothetical protein [Acidobacteriota bacterium]